MAEAASETVARIHDASVLSYEFATGQSTGIELRSSLAESTGERLARGESAASITFDVAHGIAMSTVDLGFNTVSGGLYGTLKQFGGSTADYLTGRIDNAKYEDELIHAAGGAALGAGPAVAAAAATGATAAMAIRAGSRGAASIAEGATQLTPLQTRLRAYKQWKTQEGITGRPTGAQFEQFVEGNPGLYPGRPGPGFGRYADADALASAPSRGVAVGERMPNGRIAGEGPGAALRNGPEFTSRSSAFREAKRDLGIPMGQQAEVVRRVPLTDQAGRRILDAGGRPVMTREYVFTRADGSKVIVQEHSAGHRFGQGGVGDQGPHFNVRPFEDPRGGRVPGTQEHYPFERR
jgi:hypothetical protein